MRYDKRRSIYRDCRWCSGRGCLACESEANKAYQRAFPDGPKPIAVFRNPEDIEAARSAIGIEALQNAFAPGGGGMGEILANLERLKTPTEGEA